MMKRKLPLLNKEELTAQFKGVRVFVYYNLHKHVWSVKCVKSGLVLCHTNDITLEDCEFKVSEKGRQRVLKTKQKNVHAGVRGVISNERFCGETLVSYNPYKACYFFKVGPNTEISDAPKVRMIDRKVWV